MVGRRVREEIWTDAGRGELLLACGCESMKSSGIGVMREDIGYEDSEEDRCLYGLKQGPESVNLRALIDRRRLCATVQVRHIQI